MILAMCVNISNILRTDAGICSSLKGNVKLRDFIDSISRYGKDDVMAKLFQRSRIS
jgi:hypothetical protein